MGNIHASASAITQHSTALLPIRELEPGPGAISDLFAKSRQYFSNVNHSAGFVGFALWRRVDLATVVDHVQSRHQPCCSSLLGA